MRISELTTRSAKLNTGTAYFPVDQSSDTVTNKIDYAELAKQIITEYNAQTLAGTAQSVKAALDTINGRFCVTGNVTGETVQEFIANAVPLLNVPSDLKTATFSAVWANHGYVSGFIRKLRAAGGYNGMFKISSGDSASASEEYTFYSWDDVTFYANKMPTRAEMDALNSNLTTIYSGTDSFSAIDPIQPNNSKGVGAWIDNKIVSAITDFDRAVVNTVSGVYDSIYYSAVFSKANDSYYSGIVWSYHNNARHTLWYFKYNNGTYVLRPLATPISL